MQHASSLEILTYNESKFYNVLMDMVTFHMILKHITSTPSPLMQWAHTKILTNTMLSFR